MGSAAELRQIGRYHVVGLIAEGGMAWVFEVIDPRLNARRALKMVKDSLTNESDFARFEAEAKLLAQIDHPNLITPFELDKDPATGCFYYTMTLAAGGSLWQQGKLDVAEAAPLYIDVLSALSAIHDHGIVHRDIKPSNIFRLTDGRALLGDLGIARDTRDSRGLTKTGTAIGTAAYMSPEQAHGGLVEPTSDVFSVGLSLFQTITGRSVYDHIDGVDTTSAEQVLMYLGHLLHDRGELDINFPPEVPREIAAVIRKACRFRAEDRYPDGGAMYDALEAALDRIERRQSATRWRPDFAPIRKRGSSAMASIGSLVGKAREAVGRAATATWGASAAIAGSVRLVWSASIAFVRRNATATRERVVHWARAFADTSHRAVSSLRVVLRLHRHNIQMAVGGLTLVLALGFTYQRWGTEFLELLSTEPVASPAEAVPLEPQVSIEEPPAVVEVMGPPSPVAGLPQIYQEYYMQLQSVATDDAAKRELIRRTLQADPTDNATSLLLMTTQNASVVVSMAGIAALKGRTGDGVTEHLVELLADETWQRRAWAARILAGVEEESASEALRRRLSVETDSRVIKQLKRAIPTPSS